MAYKSPLNNLPVFKTQKFEREYGKPVVAPEVNIPQKQFSVGDFTDQIGGASKDKDSTRDINPAKAARLKGRQARKQVRQEARAKRIEKRQDKKTVKAMQRQDKKNVKAGIAQDFQKSLPKPSGVAETPKAKISGEMLTGFVPSSGGASSITPKPKITGALGSDLRKKQYDDAGFKYDDTIKGYNRDGSKIEVPAMRGRGKFGPIAMIDPSTGMEMTVQPPMPANQMGTAKPMFNQTTQNVGNQVYGTPFQRQMSMGQQAPVFMKDIPEGNKGAGLRALDDSVVEQMGYDAATKMVSPVEFHEGVSHDRTVLGQKYSLGAENYADSVRVAKREQRFNEMMKPKMMKTLVDKSRVSTSTSAKTSSEAQEIPRIKKKK
jgi:hypothetical protein